MLLYVPSHILGSARVTNFGKVECAVSDLTDVKWYPESFHTLKIPEDTKQTLLSLATTRLGLIPTVPFDDIIKGKGRGLNVLLQ